VLHIVRIKDNCNCGRKLKRAKIKISNKAREGNESE